MTLKLSSLPKPSQLYLRADGGKEEEEELNVIKVKREKRKEEVRENRASLAVRASPTGTLNSNMASRGSSSELVLPSSKAIISLQLIL